MEILFPLRGIHRGGVASKPPPLTFFDGDNVRPYDILENRARGGQRPAQDKWGDGDRLGSAYYGVVAICSVGVTESSVS